MTESTFPKEELPSTESTVPEPWSTKLNEVRESIAKSELQIVKNEADGELLSVPVVALPINLYLLEKTTELLPEGLPLDTEIPIVQEILTNINLSLILTSNESYITRSRSAALRTNKTISPKDIQHIGILVLSLSEITSLLRGERVFLPKLFGN